FAHETPAIEVHDNSSATGAPIVALGLNPTSETDWSLYWRPGHAMHSIRHCRQTRDFEPGSSCGAARRARPVRLGRRLQHPLDRLLQLRHPGKPGMAQQLDDRAQLHDLS